METKELNNQLNNDSVDPKDYEVEIPSKKGFFSSFLDKFKINNKQKLLSSGNSTQKTSTHRSISSLWRIGNIRSSLFKSLDYLHKKINNRISSRNSIATFVPEIINENSQDKDTKVLTDNSINIVPKVKPTPINHTNFEKRPDKSKGSLSTEDLER